MNDFEIGLLVWAIAASLIAIFELFLLMAQLDADSESVISHMNQIAKLNEKLTETETDNLLLRSQIKELKLQANKQPVKVKVRKKGEKKK